MRDVLHSQIDKELALFEAWIAENPSSRLFFRLAEIYSELKRGADAIALLEKALLFHPQHIPGRLLLADIYQEQGRPEQALAHVRQAALSIIEHAQVFSRLGRHLPQHRDKLDNLARCLEEAGSLLGVPASKPPARMNLVLDKLERLRKAAGIRRA